MCLPYYQSGCYRRPSPEEEGSGTSWTMLKAIRSSSAMREEFRILQIRFGRSVISEVPSLGVETRCNSMFLMIDGCYGRQLLSLHHHHMTVYSELQEIFEALCNTTTFRQRLVLLT